MLEYLNEIKYLRTKLKQNEFDKEKLLIKINEIQVNSALDSVSNHFFISFVNNKKARERRAENKAYLFE